MPTSVREGTLLWEPPEEFKQGSELQRYSDWLRREKGLSFSDYESMWKWSVENVETFWATIVDFFGVELRGSSKSVLSSLAMPGAKWFEGAEINYVSGLLRFRDSDTIALICYSEVRERREVSWKQLIAQVSAFSRALRQAGVHKGDRVVAYIPNIPEAVVAFLATASLGAVWSSTSPDFGSHSVVDRFKQIEPKVLITVDGYSYGGKAIDRIETVNEIRSSIPSLTTVVLIPYLAREARLEGAVAWKDFCSKRSPICMESVEFNSPLWILFSSGTTGLPKAIVQSQGGVLLEHLKALSLHLDLKEGDRFMWWTTTGWMMWNFLVGALQLGSTIVLYDGSPGYPDMSRLWKIADESRLKVLGAGAAYYSGCAKADIHPGKIADLSHLRTIGSTGSPLSPELFKWLYDEVKSDLWVVSLSGGTDVCTAFLGGSPTLPVRAGELQCRSLGAPVYAFDEKGKEAVDEVGELVLTAPMPSMPIYFWNDPDMGKYRGSYFDLYPGIWRHGDWVRITKEGGAYMYGRSDATLKKKGVRMGTAEIYAAVEAIPEISDSLIVGVDLPGGEYYMPLFVVLKDGATESADLKKRISEKIRVELSSRHVPDDIIVVKALPRTLNGKKLEVPVRKILMGIPPEKAMNPGSVTDPKLVYSIAEIVSARLKASPR